MNPLSNPTKRHGRSVAAAVLWLVAGTSGPALAEPYIAVQNGLSCSACHVNRTGGGQRNTFGSGVGRTSIPSTRVENLWEGVVADRLRFGADLRAGYIGNLRDDEPFIGEYELSAANLYLSVDVIPERLTLYLDQSVTGSATTREAFALIRARKSGIYRKTGRFFLPYGLRFQDDAVATRRATGFNFQSSDVGVEFGAEPGDWSIAASITNGTSGGAENDNGKQVAVRGEYICRRWRVGASGSNNDLPGSTRRAVGGLFGGVEAGPVVVLLEWNRIRDEIEGMPDVETAAAHLEADWTLRRGITLRGWAGRTDPDDETVAAGEDPTRDQFGLGADWTPLPGLQARAYYRYRDGPRSVPGTRDDEAVVELHLYF